MLPAITLLLVALAVYLARGRRRRTLRTSGWCFVLIGVVLLLIRRVAGNAVVNGLVKVPSNKPAVHQVWSPDRDVANSMKWELAIAAGAVVIFCLPGASNVWGERRDDPPAPRESPDSVRTRWLTD